MTILAFESSAAPASVCLLKDGRIAAFSWQNIGYTHSQTLLPTAAQVLNTAGISAKDIDAFALANGPGSFTGLRIGAATVKGLAWVSDKPCLPVSTLLAMCYAHLEFDGVVCAAMDARRAQLYTALFRVCHGTVTRLSDDAALAQEELGSMICTKDAQVLFTGDGAEIAYAAAERAGTRHIMLAPENTRLQSAVGVALAALREGIPVSAAELAPNYLRKSQAEREREKKEAQK